MNRDNVPGDLVALTALLLGVACFLWYSDVAAQVYDDDDSAALVESVERPSPEDIAALAESVAPLVLAAVEDAAEIDAARKGGADGFALATLVITAVLSLLLGLLPSILRFVAARRQA